MNQAPVWPAATDTAPEARLNAAHSGAPAEPTLPKPTPTPKHGRLSPLQTAAATAVIFTSLAGLAAMTGVLSIHRGDQPALPYQISAPTFGSTGVPEPQSATAPALAPFDVITEVNPPGAAMHTAVDAIGTTSTAGSASAMVDPGKPVEPRSATAAPAHPDAAAAPATSRRHTRHAVPHQKQHRPHQGKTREQVVEELMQAKRDGSYRASQENYR